MTLPPTPVLTPADACHPGEGHCITCSDEGIAMRVVRAGDQAALCRDPDRDLHEVAVDLIAPVRVGDEVLVHAGVAIGHLGVSG